MPLPELPVLFIDAQTTAAVPRLGRILELALRLGDEPARAHVVRLEGEAAIAPRILRLTGITQDEIDGGIAEDELFAVLQAMIDRQPAIAVIHYAAFERRFLDDLWLRRTGSAFPLEVICTHAIAQRLFPKLPSRSLRAMAGFFGAHVDHLKRASGHVDATAHIWARVCSDLALLGVGSLESLRLWLTQKPPRSSGPKQFPLDRALRLALPNAPGVYRMVGPSGQVLYVGKATSLHARVNSYFRQRRGLGSPKNEMLTQIVSIDATPCASPLEAALLETDEIKRLAPPYNIALRERTRPLGFFDRQLQLVTAGDKTVHLGPFANPQALDPVIILAAALRGGLADGLLLAGLFHEELPPSVLSDGLKLFEKTLPFATDQATPRSLLAFATMLARSVALVENQEVITDDDDQPEDDADAERVWTADDVASNLSLLLAHTGRAFIRSKRLNRLANATIVFRVPHGEETWRYLTFSGGALAASGWTPDPDTAPRTQITLALGDDGRTYDRMRVLSTELLRLDGTAFIVSQ